MRKKLNQAAHVGTASQQAVDGFCPTPALLAMLRLWVCVQLRRTWPILESSQLLGHHSLLMLLPEPVGLF